MDEISGGLFGVVIFTTPISMRHKNNNTPIFSLYQKF
jgi:hypothetical protein